MFVVSLVGMFSLTMQTLRWTHLWLKNCSAIWIQLHTLSASCPSSVFV